MDPIQKGLAELESQRKMSAFNISVLCSALRESSEHFRGVRKKDYDRMTSLTKTLRDALEEQAGEARSPAYWSERAEAHATSMGVYSKFYAAMMGVLGLITAYFFGGSDWAVTIALGLLLVILTKAKWGVDKYCANLERIQNHLSRITEAGTPEGTQ